VPNARIRLVPTGQDGRLPRLELPLKLLPVLHGCPSLPGAERQAGQAGGAGSHPFPWLPPFPVRHELGLGVDGPELWELEATKLARSSSTAPPPHHAPLALPFPPTLPQVLRDLKTSLTLPSTHPGPAAF
jgi:hypothetical protein